MRQQESLQLLESALSGSVGDFFTGQPLITKLPELRHSLKLLAEIPGLTKEAAGLLEESSIGFGAESTVKGEPWNQLRARVERLMERAKGVMLYLRADRTPEDDAATVYVMLPPETDLTSTAEYVRRVDRALKLVVIHPALPNATVQLRGCDSGSVWLEIFLGSAKVVSLVGMLGWAAAVIYKKIQEGRMHARYVESLDLKNDSLRNIVERQDELLGILVETEALNLSRKFYGEEIDPEQTERVKVAIKELADLIERGTRIHPALQAPEQVKNLFPDFRKILQLESATKLIEETASEPRPDTDAAGA